MRIHPIIATLLLMPLAFGQEFRATISGVVSDTSGATIAGAKVIATEVRTNTRTAVESEQNGHYTLPFLLPGEYTVSAGFAGFKEFRREGLQVGAGETPVAFLGPG